jgi:hypothetical protein
VLHFASRAVLAVAVLVGTIAFSFEAYAAVRHTTLHPPDSEATDGAVIASYGISVTTLRRLESTIPKGASYHFRADSTLTRSERGQAVTAWVQSRLLPRIERDGARWQIIWSRRRARCCGVRVIGRITSDSPPIVVRHD